MGFETDYQKKYGQTPSQTAKQNVASGGFESSYNALDEEKKKKARQTAIELSKQVEKPKEPSFFEKAGQTLAGIGEKLGFKKKIDEQPSQQAQDILKQVTQNPIQTIIPQKNIFDDLISKESVQSAQITEYGKSKVEIVENKIKDTLVEISKRTSGTGIAATIRSASPEVTFKEAYEAARKSQQENNDTLPEQFLTGLFDTLPQTAFGIALGFVPIAGPALTTSYWASVSAGSEIEEKGYATPTNVAIDVLGDRMLGGMLETLFKAPAKSLFKVVKEAFIVEGGTEVAQDLAKFANEYRLADTDEKRQQVVDTAKNYFTSGQILVTAGVGGVSGSSIAGVATVIQNKINMSPSAVMETVQVSDLGGTAAGKELEKMAKKAEKQGREIIVDPSGQTGDVVVETPEGNKIGISLGEKTELVSETGTTKPQDAVEQPVETKPTTITQEKPKTDLPSLIEQAKALETRGADKYTNYWSENKNVPMTESNKNWKSFLSETELTKLDSINTQIEKLKGKEKLPEPFQSERLVKKPEVEAEVQKVDEVDQLQKYVKGLRHNDSPEKQKGIGMEFSALKRGLEGKPTENEARVAKKYLESNHTGKVVTVNGEQGTITKTAFGKVGVKLADGSVKFFNKEVVTSKPVSNSDIIDHIVKEAKKEFESKKQLYSGFKPAETVQKVVEEKLTPEVKPTEVTKEPTIQVETRVVKTSDEINKPLRDFYKANNTEALGEAQMQVMMEMEVAEAGKRFKTEDGEWTGTKSTFPQWVPEELRTKELFNKVLDGLMDLENITYPDASKPRQQALYDEILSRIDSLANIDGSSIRNDIVKAYEENKAISKEQKSQSKETVSRGIEGGKKPTKKQKVTKQSKARKKFLGRVYERLKVDHPEILTGEVEYIPKHFKDEAKKAVKLVETDKQKAYRVAMGYEFSEDVNATTMNIVLAEKALDDGNTALYTQLVKNRTFALIKAGQLVVFEKASVKDNSPTKYVKELIKARLDKLGKGYLTGVTNVVEKTTTTEKAQKVIEKETVKAQKQVKESKMGLAEAQAFINSLICK